MNTYVQTPASSYKLHADDTQFFCDMWDHEGDSPHLVLLTHTKGNYADSTKLDLRQSKEDMVEFCKQMVAMFNFFLEYMEE